MHVGAGHGDAERDALRLGQQMQSAALLAATDRGRPAQRTPSFARSKAASTIAYVQSSSAWAPSSSSTARCNPRHGPTLVHEVRRRGRHPGRLQQGPPGTPAGRHVHHRREPGPLVQQRGSAALRAGVERRQQRSAKFRQTLRNQPPRQIGTPEETSCRSSRHHHVRHPLSPNLRGAPSWSRHIHPVGAQRLGIPMTAGCSQCQPCLSCANYESSSQAPQRRTRGMPRPIQEMISRWISLLPPPNVKITADR